MLDRSQLPLVVGHADVVFDMAFHSSMGYFQTSDVDRKWWKDVRRLAAVTEPIKFTKRSFVVVEGDVLADLTLPDGGSLLVYGDIGSAIDTHGSARSSSRGACGQVRA
jgi:hypothetical protein